jgi:catechol 2,3-dioxygenase-like lactoylglutathione lyase family enzyme
MNEPADLGKAHLRVVRPSDDLAGNLKFYCDGLGFEVLSEFKDHDGFDAVILGAKEAAYHLAFVHKAGRRAGRAPSEDNLLVFYLPDADEWTRSVARLEELGHKPVKAFNPYWDKRGRTFEDPDGYRVVLQHSSWPA